MSTFTINYYNPNDTNYVGTIKDISSIVLTNNTSCGQNTLNQQNCGDVRTAITMNADLANKIQSMNNKNVTALGLYNDSGIFYNTQYLQLWNMAGGIALSGFLIYYLIKKQK